MSREDQIKEQVRKRYAEQAILALTEKGCGCGDGCCSPGAGGDAIGIGIYSPDEVKELPDTAVIASLGCGNPVAVAEIRPGETILDLGSGGGIDVLLSARRAGPTGKAYGLDMTDEMLELARENQRKAGVSNAEFLKGEMEDIPLPDASVDLIISNCVVNLSPDKDRVLQEAIRVLRPGGRISIADIVSRDQMSEEVKQSLDLWTGCVAGALSEAEYREKLTASGFVDIEVQPLHDVDISSGGASSACGTETECCGAASPALGVFSGIIRARKP